MNAKLQKLLEKEMTRKEFMIILGLFIASAAGVEGFVRRFSVIAATATAAQEAETGTVTAPAVKVTDSSASGGSAIKFGPAQPVSGSGFSSKVLAVAGLTHYYPLDSAHNLQDLKGDRPLTNAGGVSFGNAGAVFNGTSSAFLTAATTQDFSVRNSANQLSFLVCVTFPTYAQPTQFHWMSKGGDVANNFEWAMRLYGDGEGQRDRGVSCYYWNPNPSFENDGTSIPGRQGDGAYMMPQEGNGTRTPNAPAGAGTVGVEHWFGINVTYTGVNSGTISLYYGDQNNQMTLLNSQTMTSTVNVTPTYTNGNLFIGKRGDNDGMVKATIRRVAFFNRTLSQTEWRSFVNPTTMALPED